MKTKQRRPTPTTEQEAAIKHLGSPLLVLAGPGTGKTTVLALRILFLLEQGTATKDQILAVTFTTKAAQEMRDRLTQYGLAKNEHPWIGTLHAVAKRILHEHTNVLGLPNNFLVADSGESKLVLNDSSFWTAKTLSLDIESVRAVIPKLRKAWCAGVMVSQINSEPVQSIYRRYQTLLRFYRAVDFDGLLIHSLTILQNHPSALEKYRAMAKFLLVDEYQDINGAQHQLLRLLAGTPDGVFAVGDDDQSIYSWRGGNPRLILDFHKSFPGASQMTLTICQRCPGQILRGALAVISKNKNRIIKALKPSGPEGEKIRVLSSKSENGEAKWIADWIKKKVDANLNEPSDITVLSTDVTIAELAYRELLKRGVSVVRRTESPLNSAPVRRIVSLIRTVVDLSDNLAVRRIIEEGPILGIGPKAIDKILLAAEGKGSDMWEVLLTPKDNGLSKWGKAIKDFVGYIKKLRERQKTQRTVQFVKGLADSIGVGADEGIKWLLMEVNEIPQESSLAEFLEHLRSKVALDVSEESTDHQVENAVCFLTTYLVKGLEAKVVFVIGLEEGLFPDPRKDIEEQRRLFYVGMTRAKSELYLCTSKMRKVRGFNFYNPSSFLAEIPQGYMIRIENI